VKAAYLLEEDKEVDPLSLSIPVRLLAGGLLAVIVVAGVFPDPLFELARAAARALM
jgi:hypothetical protein